MIKRKEAIKIALAKVDGKDPDEKSLMEKALSRFIYAFKILIKASYQKNAVFLDTEIHQNEGASSHPKSDIAFIISVGSVEQEKKLYEELLEKTGYGKVFILCFRKEHFERLKSDFTGKAFPLYYDSAKAKLSNFQDFFLEGKDPDSLLFSKVFDLIDAIIESTGTETEIHSDGETVYLAFTNERLNEERNILKRELKNLGYRVAPKQNDINGFDHDQYVNKNLGKSRLSIHLVHPSEISASDPSLAGQQNQLAIQKYRSSKGKFSRVLWIAAPENEDDYRSIERLKEDPSELEGAEVLQNSLETLRGLLRHKLNGKHKPEIIRLNGVSKSGLKVYFLYDSVDKKNAESLIEKLELHPHELLQPIFKGNFQQIRGHHLHCLQHADVVVVFVEHVNPVWVQMKFLEMLKSPGMGRTKKRLHQIIFLPKTQQTGRLKEDYGKVALIENNLHELNEKIDILRKQLHNEGNL